MRMLNRKRWGSLVITGMLLACRTAAAAGLQVEIEIPQMTVAEYHRPYVAVWIERPDTTVAAHLAVWYDVKMKNREGEEWLKDLRQWWRRGGRALGMPVDGISGATRPIGRHRLSFEADKAPLAALSPGNYRLVVEASREVGGREVVKADFEWPPKMPKTASVQGKSELGAVVFELKP